MIDFKLSELLDENDRLHKRIKKAMELVRIYKAGLKKINSEASSEVLKEGEMLARDLLLK